METQQTKRMKTLTGVVASNSGQKSIRVRIDFKVKHPKYGKYLRRQTRLAVHDESSQCRTGDTVEIAPCRPRSKTKSWRVVRVLQKAAQT
jgi:small subunit ribosomal protein S17